MARHARDPKLNPQSTRIKRRVNDSMIGSHVQRSASSQSRRHARGSQRLQGNAVDFSDDRNARRATRGTVSQVGVSARSGESDSQYARRTARRGYVEELQAQSRKRRTMLIGGIVAVVAIVAIVAGVVAFFMFSDSRLSLGNSNAKEALVEQPSEGAYYALCVADLSTSSQPQTNSDEAYMAVRIDEAAHQLTFISVPSTISVKLSDGQNHLLSEAESVGGDAELISAISSLLGVDISHFAKTDSAGLSRLVELVGGVPVQITSEIDDSTAGTAVIQPGEVTLSPNQALTLLRASNYSDPYETQAKLRAAFTVNLAERAVAGESLSFASLISDGAEGVSTDWTSSQILSLAEVVKPADSVVLYASVVPGREVTSDDGQTTYEITSNELTSMMEAINAGDAPESADESTASVDRSAVTVEVRNGSGITGAAKRCGELLEGFGYQVSKVGNTDDGTTYKETLVIYKDEAYEVAARAIVKDMDAGRVVDGGDFYTFSTNVLVIVGTDWMG